MSSQTLASLVVDLKLETSQLRQGVDAANKKIEGLSDKLGQLGKSVNGIQFMQIAGVLKDATVSLAHFVLGGAEAADKMGKMAQQVGVSVESISALDYAAGLSGLTTEQLGTSLGKLNKNLAAAGSGAKDQAVMFNALGIAVTDAAGHVRGADDVLLDLADKFSQMDDGASKSALAMEVFGKSGADLIPFLNQGKAGISELTAEAERLGIVIDSRAAASAERFNDAVEKIQRAVKGVATRTAAELTPALSRLADQFLNSKTAADSLKQVSQVLATFFKILASGAVIVAAAFQAVGTEIAAAMAGIMNIVEGNFDGNKEVTKARAEEMASIWDNLKERMEALWSDKAPLEDALDRSQKKATISADHILHEMEKAKKAIDTTEVDLAIKSSEASRKNVARKDAFDQIAPTGGSIISSFKEPPELKKARASFEDFNDALDRATASTLTREHNLAEAAEKKKEGDLKGYEFAMMAADAHAEVAENAELAAKAFEDAAKRQAQAVDGLINHFAAKMGRTGEVASAAGQGFQAGGWWGAIIAAIAELVSGSEQFAGIIEVFDGFLEGLGNAFGDALISVSEVLAALQPLLDIISGLVKSIIGLVNATHDVDSAFDILTPIFNVISNILEPIMSLVDLFSQLGGALDVFGFVIDIVTVVMNVISLTILGTVRALQGLWGWILGIVHGIMKALLLDTSGIEKLAQENQANIANTEDKMKRIVDDIAGRDSAGKAPPAIKTLDGVSAAATGAADSLEKLGNTADDVTDQLTNVPTGYKVATARFLSSLAESSSMTMATIAREVEAHFERKSFTQSGSSFSWRGGG